MSAEEETRFSVLRWGRYRFFEEGMKRGFGLTLWESSVAHHKMCELPEAREAGYHEDQGP